MEQFDETSEFSAQEAQAFQEWIEELDDDFANLCAARHAEGENKYGALTWVGNDVVRMMIEELADTANYCRYQAIKLMMMQAHLEADLSDKLGDGDAVEEITIGVKAFKGTKDVGWNK